MPVNVHLTGCHNSCAQHYIGDIGLIGAKVPVGEDGDTVEGYDIVVGGGFADGPRSAASSGTPWGGGLPGPDRGPAARLPRARRAPDETFQAFTERHDPEALRHLAEEQPVLRAAA